MSTQITKALAETLGAELRAAAADAIAAKHGLKLSPRGGGTFSDASYKPRLEFIVAGELGASRKDEDAFRAYAGLLGLKPEMLGKTFTVRNEKYRVIGAAPGRSKNSVKVLRLRDNSPRICAPGLVLAGTFID